MCLHRNLEYLGEQPVNGNGDTISLYNCKDCHTTLMIKKGDPRLKIRRFKTRTLHTH